MENRAIVFDTNFVIQHKDLFKVVEALSSSFSVYITQVTVRERISQECYNNKQRFEKIEQIQNELSPFATVQSSKTLDEIDALFAEGMQKKYKDLFKDHLIELPKDEGQILSEVITRACDKTPPFIRDASDKGFKDALIWLSILEYFKSAGESDLFFLSDDNGFVKNQAYLSREFREVTGKNIVFHPNSFYIDFIAKKEQTESEDESVECDKKSRPKNIEELRDKVAEIVADMCWVERTTFYGDEDWVKTFSTDKKMDAAYVRAVFDGLEKVISANLFESEIPASEVLERDNRITNGRCGIPMYTLERAAELFNNVKKSMPEYTNQFCSAVATVLNRNYEEPVNLRRYIDGNEELPF